MDFSTNLTQNISKKDNEESISQSGSGVCQIRHDVINLPLTFNWTSPDSNASCISLTYVPIVILGEINDVRLYWDTYSFYIGHMLRPES